MELSKRIKQLRKQKGLTQEELASRINVSRSVIAKYEANLAIPSEDNLTLLSKELGEELTTDNKKEDMILSHTKLFLLIIAFVLSLIGIILFFAPIYTFVWKQYIAGGATVYQTSYHSMLYISINNKLIPPYIFLGVSIISLVLTSLKLFLFKKRFEWFYIVIIFLLIMDVILLFLSLYFVIGCSIYI